jgi:hypothetical protein
MPSGAFGNVRAVFTLAWFVLGNFTGPSPDDCSLGVI